MINIRFLRQGLVEVQTPEGFDEMTDEEKLSWATEHLSTLTDRELVQAMADFPPDAVRSMGLFDLAPAASALESEEFSIIVQTEDWRLFASGLGQDILTRGKKGE